MTDAEKRKLIPTVDDTGTAFRPVRDNLMIIPLKDVTQVGSVILPHTAIIEMNEGHIVAKGEGCDSLYEVGDYVTWAKNHEYRMSIDGGKPFALVQCGGILMRIKRDDL